MSEEALKSLCEATHRVTRLRTPRAVQLATALKLWYWDDTQGQFASQDDLLTPGGGGETTNLQVNFRGIVIRRSQPPCTFGPHLSPSAPSDVFPLER